MANGPLPLLKMVAISLPAIGLLAVPAVTILVALLIAGVAEWIAYVPLKLVHRDKAKEVNTPDTGETLLS